MVHLSELTVAAGTSAEGIRSVYAKHGLVIVRQLFAAEAIERFRTSIMALVTAALGKHATSPAPGADLDEAYRLLGSVDPEAALALRGLVKDLVDYHRFLANENLRQVVSALIKS